MLPKREESCGLLVKVGFAGGEIWEDGTVFQRSGNKEAICQSQSQAWERRSKEWPQGSLSAALL